MEITQSEQQKEKFFLNESNLRDLCNNIKHSNICIIRVPEREEGERKGSKNGFEEITAENFSNLKTEMDIQVWEAQRVLNKMNPNRPTPR